MRRSVTIAGLIAALAMASVAPGAANAYDHHRYWRHHYGCEAHRHRAGAGGAIAGTVGGGLIGGALSHGSLPGVLLGAGAGALIGHHVAKNSVHC